MNSLTYFKSISTICVYLGLLLVPQVFAKTTPIKFGVMSLAPPARIHAQWSPFLEYMQEKTGYQFEIVIPKGFKKIKQAIAKDQVDFFYTNSLVFFRLQQKNKAVPIAQMLNLDDSIFSHSDIFVRSDSGINNIRDLKGKNMAYVSPMGAGGYLAPRALLQKNGIASKVDINETFTKNLSSSIHQVLLGEVSAATMCGLNFKLMGRKINTGELKVIASSDNYPENIIGARPDVKKSTRDTVLQAILDMPNNPEGRDILKNMSGMKVKKFVAYDRGIEDTIKSLLSAAAM